MSALRKPKPSLLPASWPYLDEAERRSWAQFVESLKPKNLFALHTDKPQRWDDPVDRINYPLTRGTWG